MARRRAAEVEPEPEHVDPDAEMRTLVESGGSANANALLASGKLIDFSSEQEKKRYKRKQATWQDEAWRYYDELGEIWFAHQFVGNCLRKVRIFAAEKTDPDQPPTAIDDGGSGVNAQAVVEVNRLNRADGGAGELMRNLAINLGVPGEGVLLGRNDLPGGEWWRVYSTSELIVNNNDKWALRESPQDKAGQELPDDTVAIRIWRNHPRWSEMPDSPMRAILDLCDELLILSRAIRAAARSRLAGAGVLLWPSETSFGPSAPITGEIAGQAVDPIVADLMKAMLTPIADEGSAAAVVPILLKLPGAQIEHVKHLVFDRPIDPALASQRVELLGRIANGLDLPAEMLLGMKDVNHWTAWQIDEQTFKAHLEPLVVAICNALTSNFLRPALRGEGGATTDPTDMPLVWYDATALIGHPNRAQDTKDAHDRILISDDAAVRYLGFAEDDMPKDEEIMARVMRKAIEKRGVLPGEQLIEAVRVSPEQATQEGGGGQGPGGGPVAPGTPGAAPVQPGPPQTGPPATRITGGNGPDGLPASAFEQSREPDGKFGPGDGSSSHGGGGQPTIESVRYDRSIDGHVVEVSPWRTEDAHGNPVEVYRFYQNGPGRVVAEGLKVKKDGTSAARLSSLPAVHTPANVAAAFNKADADKPVRGSGRPQRRVPLGLGRRLAQRDRELRTKLHLAADAATFRALERTGASLRRKVGRNKAMVASLEAVPNHLVASHIGEAACRDRYGFSDALLLQDSFDPLHHRFLAQVGAAQSNLRSILMGLDDDNVLDETDIAAKQKADLEEAWIFLIAGLSIAATHHAFSPNPAAPALGEHDSDLLAPPGMLRQALAIAGGASPQPATRPGVGEFAMADPEGGILTGELASRLFVDLGLRTSGYEWATGAPTTPFPGHDNLDGVQFSSFDDDLLGADTSEYPFVDHYFPGDHDWCQCDFFPVIEGE